MTRLCTSSATSFIESATMFAALGALPIAKTDRVSRRFLRCSFCAMVVVKAR
jgi:hypothetical protein